MAKKKSKQRTEEIPEDEQWRMINDSGILSGGSSTKIPKPSSDSNTTTYDLADELFFATLLIIPFSFLFLLFDIMVHQQYAQSVTIWEEGKIMAQNIPILSIFIFYTNRYKSKRILQFLFFFASIILGTRLFHIVNYANWKDLMRQGPPTATVWVYAIWQMDLIPCLASLAIVGGAVWKSGMKVVF